MYTNEYWKSIPKQTIFNDDPRGGDCYRCCVAAILRRPADSVPHFLQISREGGKDMISGSNAWLSENGLWLIDLGAIGDYTFVGAPSYASDKIPSIPYIATGPTVRSKNPQHTHAVVMARGQMVYDPHPSESGLLSETKRYLIVPQLWLYIQTRGEFYETEVGKVKMPCCSLPANQSSGPSVAVDRWYKDLKVPNTYFKAIENRLGEKVIGEWMMDRTSVDTLELSTQGFYERYADVLDKKLTGTLENALERINKNRLKK